jgi:hypothetical protein
MRIAAGRFGDAAAERIECITEHILKGRLPPSLHVDFSDGRISLCVGVQVRVHAVEQLPQRRQGSVTRPAALTAIANSVSVRIPPRRGKRAEQCEHDGARACDPPPGFA